MITLEEFKRLASKFNTIPVVAKLFSGTETPISIFEKLSSSTPGGFLLESAEHGVWSRFSFIGVENLGFLVCDGSKLTWNSETTSSPLPSSSSDWFELSVFDALELIQSSWNSAPVDDLPPLISGLVGLLGWDSIYQLENLGLPKPKDYPIPEMAMAIPRDLVVVDHQSSTVLLVSNAFIHDGVDLEERYSEALTRIDRMKERLSQDSTPFLAEVNFEASLEFTRQSTDGQFLEMVESAKKHVVAGDVFQVVISQRFETEVTASSLDVYRVLRALNPSPYMYLLNFFDEKGSFSVVGSSPEALVRVTGDRAVLHPIAGSRPRGATIEADSALALELQNDAKEKAEHLMLVDLARNDLLKVCEPDSVHVSEFMNVERYSHIMHLVSTVEGTVTPGNSAVGVVKATFPAGTLSGAPKPRALEIIENLEPTNRGLFGGVVGYFDFAGNADLAIAIRTAVIRDGSGYVQAGAGIVLDSDPRSENQETINKASAPLRAIQAANKMLRFRN